MAAFFKAIEGHKLELAFKMAGLYGFRRSELLGLRWQAIDFEKGTISINNKLLVVNDEIIVSDILKTKASERTLPLLPEIEELLVAQKERISENRMFYGNMYNTDYSDYVFVHEDGKIVYPNYLSKAFSNALKKNNIKHMRFHDLRHSCASIMLANGVPMKYIQDWLGHSNFATTADIYSHTNFDSKIESATLLAEALGIKAPKQKSGKAQKPEDAELAADKNNLKTILSEMISLGFETIQDYINYLDSNDEEEEKQETGFTM